MNLSLFLYTIGFLYHVKEREPYFGLNFENFLQFKGGFNIIKKKLIKEDSTLDFNSTYYPIQNIFMSTLNFYNNVFF